MASFFEIGHRVDTNIIMALVTAVVDTSTNPSLITNADTFENFLERINEPDILKWALNQRPNSDWVVEIVTNATIFVNRILQHPIGCVGIVLPPHVKYNQSVTGLAKDHHGRPYVDNLCLFRCMYLKV